MAFRHARAIDTLVDIPEEPSTGLLVKVEIIFIHIGGCQNYDPFLGHYYNTAPHI